MALAINTSSLRGYGRSKGAEDSLRGKHDPDTCPAEPRLPAGAAEGEVLRYVEDLLNDPREIVRRMDEAIERERAAQVAYARDSDATERALADRLVELAGKREKLMDLALDGPFGKEEIAKRAAALDKETTSVEHLLQRARDTAGRVEELGHTKRALVEAFGIGLKLGIGGYRRNSDARSTRR